jgi:hypothetical protein
MAPIFLRDNVLWQRCPSQDPAGAVVLQAVAGFTDRVSLSVRSLGSPECDFQGAGRLPAGPLCKQHSGIPVCRSPRRSDRHARDRPQSGSTPGPTRGPGCCLAGRFQWCIGRCFPQCRDGIRPTRCAEASAPSIR